MLRVHNALLAFKEHKLCAHPDVITITAQAIANRALADLLFAKGVIMASLLAHLFNPSVRF